MVVTRRTPVPPTPTSRTPSTQPVPRVVKKTDASSAPAKLSPLANGSSQDPLASGKADVDSTASAELNTAKSKGRQKSKKSAKKRSGGNSTSIGEVLFRLFLLWFTIYALSVCPQDEQLKSPVCRGLAEYRRLVIEPYIIPPIQQAISHPSVAPYIEKAKPYADYAIRTSKPIAARIQNEFDARVVPQWERRIVPLYHEYVNPQLVKLDAQLVPYRTRVEQVYEHLLAPYMRRTASTVYQWQHKSRPYVVLAAKKSYQGYQVARPYARPLWEKVKVVLAQLTAFLGQQRRQFVDPHVKKIWEHVKELSNGKIQTPAPQPSKSATSELPKVSLQTSIATTTLSSTSSLVAAVPGSSATSHSIISPNPSSSVIPEAVSSSEVPHVTQSTEDGTSSTVVAGDIVSSIASGVLESRASAIAASASPSLSSAVSAANDATAADPVPHATLYDVSSVQEIPSTVSTLAESGPAAVFDAESQAGSVLSAEVTSTAILGSSSDNINPSLQGVGSDTITQAPAPLPGATDSLPSTPSSVVEDSSDADLLDFLSDPDLDAFKAELGLTDDLSEPEADTRESQPAEPEENEEERLRLRREKAARERADIETRHTAWEKQMADKIEENKKVVRTALVALRKAAAAELKDSPEIRNDIEGLVNDAEKFLRGAEKYLANLKKEKRSVDESRTLWDRVLRKIEEKFSDRLRATESVVNGFYMDKLRAEVNEMKKYTEEIRNIAESGQADIGLDYAYLDGVTYLDWQRYHDLVRTAEKFSAHVEAMRNGSDPSFPNNPVVSVMNGLQEEVEDVIAGFNSRLRKVTRDGARAFGNSEESSDEDDNSASILPIEEPVQSESPADVGVPPIVIGRGKEEVEAALNRVADLEAQKMSSPDEPEKEKDADAVAQSLRDTVASEEASASSPLHQEL